MTNREWLERLDNLAWARTMIKAIDHCERICRAPICCETDSLNGYTCSEGITMWLEAEREEGEDGKNKV